MSTERAYLIHSICVDSLTIALWTAALLTFIFQFRQRSRSRRSSARLLRINLKASAIAYVVTYLLSWILWMIADIARLKHERMLGVIANIGYSLIKYPLTNLSFYALILSRLKLTFRDTMYEVKLSYFIFVLIAAVISLSLNTWWRVVYTTGGEYVSFPDRMEPFIRFCIYQYYVVDALIQISFLYLFNRRLYRLISMSREDLSHFQTPTMTPRSVIAKDLNHRQHGLVKAVSKHTLLIGIMIGCNLFWMIWCISWPVKQIDGNKVFATVEKYVFFTLNLIQLAAMYLGFDFGNDLYQRVFPRAHKLCERCCKRIAVKHIEREMENEYNMMEEQ